MIKNDMNPDYFISYFAALVLALALDCRSTHKIGFIRCALIAGAAPVCVFVLKLLDL